MELLGIRKLPHDDTLVWLRHLGASRRAFHAPGADQPSPAGGRATRPQESGPGHRRDRGALRKVGGAVRLQKGAQLHADRRPHRRDRHVGFVYRTLATSFCQWSDSKAVH